MNTKIVTRTHKPVKYKLICYVCVLSLTFGCSSINESRKSAGISRQEVFMDPIKIDGEEKIVPTLFWSHYDASQRGGIYLVNADGNVKVISENPPDVAINNTIDMLVSANVKSEVTAEAKFQAIKQVAELGEKNAGNYMIRDIAFRIESLKNNEGSIDTTIYNLYNKLIDAATTITVNEDKTKIYENKLKALQELNRFIEFSNDSNYSHLAIDSTQINVITNFIKD